MGHKAFRRRWSRAPKPIVLIGLMGAGKTTVGRRLAKRLDAPFFDSDEEIEKAAAMPIKEIFAKLGEPAFREAERKVIARLMREGSVVIATGGGAFMTEETRRLLLERAFVIWLDADMDTLVDRATRRPDHRPLLAQGDPRDVLSKLHKERAPVYAEAHAQLQSPPGPHKSTVDAAMDLIERHFKEAA